MTTKQPAELRVLGYVRRSTDKQAISPEVQRGQLASATELLGWASLELREEDAISAKAVDNRPVLLAALADLRAGRADALAVAKLDRLSRSTADFAGLLDRAEREGWAVICLDLGVDTSSNAGRFASEVTAAAASLERRLISQRTREGMAKLPPEKRDRMRLSPGRPRVIPPTSEARARELHATGLNARQVAEQLNAEGVPTHVDPARSGRWWPETVRRLATR